MRRPGWGSHFTLLAHRKKSCLSPGKAIDFPLQPHYDSRNIFSAVVRRGISMPINSRSLITGLCLALFVLNPVFAQMTVTGSISGLVTDPSGEMVAGAAITLTSELTGESRSTRTSESGTFAFAAVQPDTY